VRNITLSVEDEVVRKVRKIAIDKNTTLTQMVRNFLSSVAERDINRKEHALKVLEASFLEFGRDMGKREWCREDLHGR